MHNIRGPCFCFVVVVVKSIQSCALGLLLISPCLLRSQCAPVPLQRQVECPQRQLTLIGSRKATSTFTQLLSLNVGLFSSVRCCLRPQRPYRLLAQGGHLDFHAAPELWQFSIKPKPTWVCAVRRVSSDTQCVGRKSWGDCWITLDRNDRTKKTTTTKTRPLKGWRRDLLWSGKCGMNHRFFPARPGEGS